VNNKDSIDAGFTFVETLAVLALTAVLAAQVSVGTIKLMNKGKCAVAKTQIENYKVALQSFYIDTGHFPSAVQGLEILWTNDSTTEDEEKWQGPYLDKKITPDPWGNPYIYFNSNDGAKTSLDISVTQLPEGLPYGIICLGADGIEGGNGVEKDIFSWE